MEYNNYYDKGQTLAQSSVFAVLMRNVYTWMACGLAMTALTSMIVGRNENWVYTLATSGMYWGFAIAEIVLVLFLSARIHKLSRGRIAEGYDADICIFSEEKLIDRSDFTCPTLACEGLNYVLVSGDIAAENAIATGKRSVRFLIYKIPPSAD